MLSGPLGTMTQARTAREPVDRQYLGPTIKDIYSNSVQLHLLNRHNRASPSLVLTNSFYFPYNSLWWQQNCHP